MLILLTSELPKGFTAEIAELAEKNEKYTSF
jgi:hypothetical protein